MDDNHALVLRTTLREAFGVPDFVSDGHVHEVIARGLLSNVGDGGQPAAAGAPASPWTETTLGPAVKHVDAFVSAFLEGEFDLALCGYGVVTGPAGLDVPKVVEEPAKAARAAVERRLDGGTAVPAWFDGLWDVLLKHVNGR